MSLKVKVTNSDTKYGCKKLAGRRVIHFKMAMLRWLTVTQTMVVKRWLYKRKKLDIQEHKKITNSDTKKDG